MNLSEKEGRDMDQKTEVQYEAPAIVEVGELAEEVLGATCRSPGGTPQGRQAECKSPGSSPINP